MKKIFYVLMIALVSVLMMACDKKYTFDITIDDYSELRNSIVVNYTIVDPDKALKGSSISAEIFKRGEKVAVTANTISYNASKLSGETKFLGLDSGVEYTVKFSVGYEGKQVYLENAVVDVKTKSEGNSAETPYMISTVEEFSKLIKNDPKGYYKLANDIDFKGTSFAPLFDSKTPFEGTFDGANFKLINFKVGTDAANPSPITTKNYGLFGYIGEEGTIQNVTLEQFNLFVSRNSSTVLIGLLAGYNAGTISNVKVVSSAIYYDLASSTSNNTSDGSGNLTGYYVGGLVGHSKATSVIKDCSVDLDITVKAKRHIVIGGIVADTYDNTEIDTTKTNITNCSYTGEINVDINNTSHSSYEATTCIGGIVGRNYLPISDCTTTGTISYKSAFNTPSKNVYRVFTGGLVGWNVSNTSAVLNSSSSMTTTFDSKDVLNAYVGLLVGRNGGGVANNTTKAKVSNCTYTLPEGGVNEVSVFDGRGENVGLIGLDGSSKTTCKSTNSFNITVNTYENGKDENNKEIFVLKTTTLVAITASAE